MLLNYNSNALLTTEQTWFVRCRSNKRNYKHTTITLYSLNKTGINRPQHCIYSTVHSHLLWLHAHGTYTV